MDVFRTSAIIPTLQLGNPLTLQSASDVEFYELSSNSLTTGGTSIDSSISDDSSDRLIIDTSTAQMLILQKSL